MKAIQGDLIKLAVDGQFDVIVHGCNCFCTMGAGIAKAVKDEFPEAYAADLSTIKGSREKLGTFSEAMIIRNGHKIVVINAYSQFHWRGKGNKADYNSLKAIFSQIKKKYTGKRIGYPLIGAGLAGGDWIIISQIIEKALQGENHTLVKLTP